MNKNESTSWINEFHRINVARQHEAFAPAHSLLGLVACASEEIGELAGAALGIAKEKKRKLHHTNDDLLDAVADAITYLSLIADRAGCSDLQGLLAKTFNMVSERAGSKMMVSSEVLPEGIYSEVGGGSWERLNTENERLKRENEELSSRLSHAQRVIAPGCSGFSLARSTPKLSGYLAGIWRPFVTALRAFHCPQSTTLDAYEACTKSN